MKASFTLLILAMIASVSAVCQEQPLKGPDAVFHDDLLDHLVGKWNITGMVHGEPSTQHLDAEWVLNHQFLRVRQKSVEHVGHTNVRYEGVYFIGYDNAGKRYVTHLLNVFGGHDSEVLGYGQRSGNEIKFVFADTEGSISTRFIWQPDSKTWHILNAAENAGDDTKPFLDLKAKRAK